MIETETLPKPETVDKEETGGSRSAAPCSLSSILDTVICGDNCEVMRGLPDECVDLVVTSPPYDDLRTYGGHSWDLPLLASELTRVLKPGGVIVWVVADATVNGSETLTSMRQAIHFKDVCGLNVHDTMIYQKNNPCPSMQPKRYQQCWEYCFIFSKGEPQTLNPIYTKTITLKSRGFGARSKSAKYRTEQNKHQELSEYRVRHNIFTYDVGNKASLDKIAFDHPAIFPEALAKDHVTSWSNPGDVVLDPFAGSGTTLKAAKELNRRFIGIEVNPEYVKICNKRTAQEVLPLFRQNA